MKTYSFENLGAWKASRNLVKEVYEVTALFPPDEKFGLVSQMRRAAVSIPSNIAEGTGRGSLQDKKHFYRIAYSSLLELLNQVIIAKDLNFVSEHSEHQLRIKIDKSAFLISKLVKSLGD